MSKTSAGTPKMVRASGVFPAHCIQVFAHVQVGSIWINVAADGQIIHAEADLFDADFKCMLIDDPNILRIFGERGENIDMSILHPFPRFRLDPVDLSPEDPFDWDWTVGRLVDITKLTPAARFGTAKFHLGMVNRKEVEKRQAEKQRSKMGEKVNLKNGTQLSRPVQAVASIDRMQDTPPSMTVATEGIPPSITIPAHTNLVTHALSPLSSPAAQPSRPMSDLPAPKVPDMPSLVSRPSKQPLQHDEDMMDDMTAPRPPLEPRGEIRRPLISGKKVQKLRKAREASSTRGVRTKNVATTPNLRSYRARTTTLGIRKSRKSGHIPTRAWEHGTSKFGQRMDVLGPSMVAHLSTAKGDDLWNMVYHERKAVANDPPRKTEFRSKLRNFIEREEIDLDLYNEYANCQSKNGANKHLHLPIFERGTTTSLQQADHAHSSNDIEHDLLSHSKATTASLEVRNKLRAHNGGRGAREPSFEQISEDSMDIDSEYEA